MEGRRLEGHITDPRNKRMEERSRKQERMEASAGGKLGPRIVYSAIDGWLGVGMVITGRRDYMGIIGRSRSYQVSVGVYFAYRSHIAEPPTVIKELQLKETHQLCSVWLEGGYL